jgi:RNA polymerase sigma-70 factor (ECF subfamily)
MTASLHSVPNRSSRAIKEISPEVVQRAKEGDRAAMTQVLEASQPYIRNMLWKLVGLAPELDDLQQIALEMVVTRISGFRQQSQLSTWVAGICVNVARTHRWRRRREAVHLPVESASEVRADTASPDDRSAAAQELKRCEAILQQLSAEQRTVFVLCAIQGHTIEEACEIMGAARSTTRMRLYFARKRFAKRYAEDQARRFER